ncbi:hypothetical protein IWQ56_000767, partial [Coemansia nantahalensis]
MLLRNLPEDILAIVLRWCALDSYDATDSLKRNLPLLAVCRQWRHLAMPLVYSRAFVQYGKQEAINNLSTGDPSEEEPANVAAKTNLDLVAMNGLASKWRVVELKVAMHPSPYSFEARNVDMTRHTDDIAKINPAASQDIAHLVLPETRYFSLVVYPGSRGDPSGLPVVNRILERARGSEILGLTIEEDILPVVPESITCTTLTYLSISAPTSVDTMLALIETLPNLTTLTFFDLDLSDVRADISLVAGGIFRAKLAVAVAAVLISAAELWLTWGQYPLASVFTIAMALQSAAAGIAVRLHYREQLVSCIASTPLLLYWLASGTIALVRLRTAVATGLADTNPISVAAIAGYTLAALVAIML